MSRTSVLMATMTDQPLSTSELYDRVGYLTLTRLGLIPYHAFHAELERLAATGAVACEIGPDGSTMWRLAGDADVAPASDADVAPSGDADMAPTTDADVAPASDAEGPDGRRLGD